MELSMEKTKITVVEEGFIFWLSGWCRQRVFRSENPVGNLFIPKSKLADLRYKIKEQVRAMPTGEPLARIIGMLNPLIRGGAATIAMPLAPAEISRSRLRMTQRVGRWLRKKHPKATWHELYRRFSRSPRGERLR